MICGIVATRQSVIIGFWRCQMAKPILDRFVILQADYAAGEDYKPFEQQEQDRLALCFILDYFDDLKTQIKTIKKERKNYGK